MPNGIKLGNFPYFLLFVLYKQVPIYLYPNIPNIKFILLSTPSPTLIPTIFYHYKLIQNNQFFCMMIPQIPM